MIKLSRLDERRTVDVTPSPLWRIIQVDIILRFLFLARFFVGREIQETFLEEKDVTSPINLR